MLSVLIPVFDYDSRTLAKDLVHSILKAGIKAEILMMEDGSKITYPPEPHLDKDVEIRYIVHEKNWGRSAIRNKLALEARYDLLLFLDCDGILLTSGFIAQYLSEWKPESDQIISGGRLYSQNKPPNDDLFLHWKYGRFKESLPWKTRASQPYISFHSNNFLVKKEIVIRFPFDEQIQAYGHEDSQWASVLNQNQILIRHIDNPVMHEGLETTSQFLQKSKIAAENLAILNQRQLLLQWPMPRLYQNLLNWPYPIREILIFSFYRFAGPSRWMAGQFRSLVFLNFYKWSVYVGKRSGKC